MTAGTQVTIDPTVTLAEATGYYVNIAATAFKDASNNFYAGIADPTTWNFTTADATAPTVVTYSPLDNAIGVVVGTNLVLTFSETVVAGTGNIVIKKVSDNSIVETIAASATVIAGAQVTIDPTVTLAEATGYYVNIDATAFKDGSNNFYAGIADPTTWNFTTADATAPTVVTYSPLDNAIGVVVGTNLVLTFSETVVAGTGNIVIKKVSDNSIVETIAASATVIAGAQVTIDPTVTLAEATGYYVNIDATAFKDGSNNFYAGIADPTTWNFTTADATAPTVVTYSPLDNAIGVVVGTNLVLTFSETVVAGTGNIVIKKVSDNSIVETIAASATVIAGAQVTIDPTVTLAEATGYYVNIEATAFKDGSNNFYAGIADPTTWNFTTADATAPTVVTYSPLDNAIGVVVGTNLVLTFSETVVAGTGNIVIKKVSDNTIVETIAASATVIAGAQVTIDPTVTLAEATGYYVNIDATAFKDGSNNFYAGLRIRRHGISRRQMRQRRR